MENLEISEIPYDYRKKNEENVLAQKNTGWIGAKTNSEDFENVGKAKVDSLKDNVNEIEEMIGERQKLSLSFIREGESMKNSINNFLLENAPKGEDDSEFARERAELRKKQIEISELQLNEKIGCWRDISMLKRELRENTREINEKINRAEMLGKILED